ncbi:hypothetical protein SAMN05660330_03840 [Desulforhopalus singaporensis]|uniref:Uncharacterized protein n=1 Tax=Desulforhopalus singaporensis TaxID=91360 RepID=A0A1H0V2Z8_9BACT|nr:hypothetical protein SAMN05660330_03840 [Desulforhopalus singaporensis]
MKIFCYGWTIYPGRTYGQMQRTGSKGRRAQCLFTFTNATLNAELLLGDNAYKFSFCSSQFSYNDTQKCRIHRTSKLENLCPPYLSFALFVRQAHCLHFLHSFFRQVRFSQKDPTIFIASQIFIRCTSLIAYFPCVATLLLVCPESNGILGRDHLKFTNCLTVL